MVLRVHYNVQPWFGPLTWNTDQDYMNWKAIDGGVSKKFALPPVKKKDQQKSKKP